MTQPNICAIIFLGTEEYGQEAVDIETEKKKRKLAFSGGMVYTIVERIALLGR